MSDPPDPAGGPPGYQPPWAFPPPEEPVDPTPPARPPEPPWQDPAEQWPFPSQPRERPSKVSRPHLSPPAGDQQPSGPLQAPNPPYGEQAGQGERPDRPSRRSRPFPAPQQPQQPQQTPPDQHPSGPFDASGAPIRPYGEPSGPLPSAPQAGPPPSRPPLRSGPFPAPPAPEAPAPPRPSEQAGPPGPDGDHPSGPFDPSGAPAPNGRGLHVPGGRSPKRPGPPGSGTGRQARHKAGNDKPGSGRHRSGPFGSGSSNQPKPSRPSGGASGHGANLVMAAALLAVAVGAAALVARLPGGQRTAATPAGPVAAPYSSRWICPVLPAAKASVTVANSGKEAAQVRATLSASDAKSPDRPATRRELNVGQPLAAGAARALEVDAKQPSLLEVESFGAPVAVDAAGQPTCATSAAERWWLTAADTSRGKVDVVLANPSSEGAVVQLVLHASNTVYRPGALKRVFVPAHSAVSRNLNGFAELDMAVEVVALLGRVVAGAVTTAPGAKQPVVIPGQPGAQASWSFAGGRGGKGDDTGLALANPSLDPLVVDVRVVTIKDAFTPPGFEDLEIPSGATRRVPIDVNNAPGGAMGVEVRSRTGAPFTAALVVRPKAGTGDPYIDTGSPRLWERWFLPRAGGKRSLVLANLGSDPITATIADLGRPDEPAIPVQVPAGRILVKEINGAKGAVVVDADHSGLVVTPAGPDGAIPSVMVEGTPLRGPVLQGPAAG